jgi:XTP/dITP diphosphohydrolase
VSTDDVTAPHIVPPRVVVASRNRGKLKEIFALLSDAGLALELVTIDDLAPETVLTEDGDTFEANALAKARQAAVACRLPALADDSGLEVDALGGAPGVRSARYAGEPSDDERNNQKLIQALAALPEGSRERSGRFRCVAAFVDPTRSLALCAEGTCEGQIVTVPRGGEGFGYDPLFLIPSLGRTMAELPAAQKNQLSHRAAAFRALAQKLAPLYTY